MRAASIVQNVSVLVTFFKCAKNFIMAVSGYVRP